MTTTQKDTGKRNAENSKYDSAWKKVVRQLFEEFLEFFFLEIHGTIDFNKEILFLDKELKEIDPNSNQRDRVADVLVKVHLKDGNPTYICIVIHIEIQGQDDPDFMERMFVYFYRAFDKERSEKIPVMSIAVLTDDNRKYRPEEYEIKLLGFEMRMKIPTVKILDYKLNKELAEKLETSSNPMTMVVKAQLKSHEVKQNDSARKFEVAKELIRECYKRGYSREKTYTLLKFFEWVIRLPEVYREEIKQVIKTAEEEFKMEYIPIWLRDTHKEGEKIGIKIGEKRGKKRGLKQGMKQNAEEIARKMLDRGYTIEIIADLTGLSTQDIKKLVPTTH